MLNELKVAQMAAYLLYKRGGSMSLLKLTKLLYLAERESIKRLGRMMSGDSPVSMPHGPVLSQTLDIMNGATRSSPGGWEEWICDREGHEVSLRSGKQTFDRARMDELSEADIQVLDAVWERFGQMNRWEIRDWTHEHCSEWRDPEGSSNPIPLKCIFAAVGYPPEQADVLAREEQSRRYADRMLSAL